MSVSQCTDYDLDYGTECLHLAQKYMRCPVRLIDGPDNLWKVWWAGRERGGAGGGVREGRAGREREGQGEEGGQRGGDRERVERGKVGVDGRI